MDSKELMDLLRRNIIPIGLGVFGLLLLAVGVFQFFSKKPTEPAVTFEQTSEEKPEAELVVDISGAVIKPGVYKITSESRMVDALAAAGGLAEDADREYVEKNINLAGKLTDGLKIYIPRVGEDILPEAASTSTIDSNTGPVININIASITDLNTLPGVGEVTAQKIIEGRPYSSSQELLDKKIVGSAIYEKIKDKIGVN